MKKLLALVLVVMLFLAFHWYTEQRFEETPAVGMMERLETWAGKLGGKSTADR